MRDEYQIGPTAEEIAEMATWAEDIVRYFTNEFAVVERVSFEIGGITSKYKVVVTGDKGDYSARVVEIPECVARGETLAGARGRCGE